MVCRSWGDKLIRIRSKEINTEADEPLLIKIDEILSGAGEPRIPFQLALNAALSVEAAFSHWLPSSFQNVKQ